MSYCPLDLVENYLKRFVSYPSEHARVAHTLWIAHTHLSFHVSRERVRQNAGARSDRIVRAQPSFIVQHVSGGFSADHCEGTSDRELPAILYDEIDNVFSKSEEGISDLRGGA
jgi:hypothetical protein